MRNLSNFFFISDDKIILDTDTQQVLYFKCTIVTSIMSHNKERNNLTVISEKNHIDCISN